MHMLGGGGMWKWDVGELSSLTLDAGQSVTTATVATLPLVAPGEDQLFVHGFTGGDHFGSPRLLACSRTTPSCRSAWAVHLREAPSLGNLG